MIVEQIWTGNSWRNFNYLIACRETGEALAVDPLDYEKCLNVAKEKGWDITQIVNTHEHHDHIGGNDPLIKATGAKLLAHQNARNTIPGIDVGLKPGDIIKVGHTVELEALDTPGHTMSHVCLLSHTEEPSLFSGDTLFNAGAGNCHGGGHPEHLYESFHQQLERLSDNTWIYPGHDYIVNNLEFTLDREPGNEEAQGLLAQVQSQDPDRALVTNLVLEKQVNSFFRLRSPTIIRKLQEQFPDLPDDPDPKSVFLKLRELRNSW